MTTDAVLTIDPITKYYDINIATSGDIETDDFFDTSLLYSIFGERRASPDEMVDAPLRRGWIGNLVNENGFENGSKIWLFRQARITRTNLNRIQDEALKSLQWLVEDNYATSIDQVIASVVNGKVTLDITIRRSRDKVVRRFYELWENTGAN
jgi:phage gp46-like protein